MPKYGTNEGVIEAFVSGSDHPCTNSSRSATQRGGILFSYAEPIGIRREDCFIVNGDVWSKTTSSHQQELQFSLRRRRKSYFTTSFSALAGIVSPNSRILRPRSSMLAEKIRDQLKILDWTKDWWLKYAKTEEMFCDRLDGNRYTYDQLPLGMEVRYKDYEPHEAHLPGAVLMEYEKDGTKTHAIAAMDERQYFVSILPRLANDVADAFTSLKPQEAVEAQQKGLKVLRQGEWFFIEHLEDKEAREEYKNMEQEFKLIGRNGGNPHIATRGEWLDVGVALVSGSIRHEEHRTLRLSVATNPLIFVAVENTALYSFSAQGVVD